MPDEPKTESEVKAESPVLVDASKLGESIAAGLARTLPDAMRAAQGRSDEPPRQVAPPPIDDVSEDDIAAAFADGDKARGAALLRKKTAADRERIRREDLSPILTGGGAAIAELAEQSIQGQKHYKAYSKEIKAQLDLWRRNNPGAVLTPSIAKAAYTYVIGEHSDEIVSAEREEAIRKSKEPEIDLTPSGGRRGALSDEEPEPTTLIEVLGTGWKDTWSRKQKAPGVRGRSEDEEMVRMGFGGVAGFIKARQELNAQIDDMGLGLDREWGRKENRWLTPEESRRLALPQ